MKLDKNIEEGLGYDADLAWVCRMSLRVSHSGYKITKSEWQGNRNNLSVCEHVHTENMSC